MTYPSKTKLEDLQDVMNLVYMDLLKKFCIGKKYLQLQNSWFFHVNVYFDFNVTVEGLSLVKANDLFEAWKAISAETEEQGCAISMNDQRLFLVTLSAIIFDMMSNIMKDEKHSDNHTETNVQANTAIGTQVTKVIIMNVR